MSFVSEWSQGFLSVAIIATIYSSLTWFGSSHLSKTAKEDLSLWMLGAYKESWVGIFCSFFDQIFGAEALSKRRFVAVIIQSVGTALVICLFLFSTGLSDRLVGETGNLFLDMLFYVLLLNIVVDYVALLKTRYFMGQAHRTKSLIHQILFLIADLVSTIFIFYIVFILVALIVVVFEGEGFAADQYGGHFQMLSRFYAGTVQFIAFQSILSVAFYTTLFANSWAWILMFSLWFVRLLTGTSLASVLDVEERPENVLSLVVSLMLILPVVAITYILMPDTSTGARRIDVLACYISSSNCQFVGDYFILGKAVEKSKVTAMHFYDRGCLTPSIFNTNQCYEIGKLYQSSDSYDGDILFVARYLSVSCHRDKVDDACFSLGYIFASDGPDFDFETSKRAYEKVCNESTAIGCNNLGVLHQADVDGAEGSTTAIKYFSYGCINGEPLACKNWGSELRKLPLYEQDLPLLLSIFKIACSGGFEDSCANKVLYQTLNDISDE